MYVEIKAYVEMMEESLNKWDVSTLKAMDSTYLTEVQAMNKGK